MCSGNTPRPNRVGAGSAHLATRSASREDLPWLIELRLATMAEYLDAAGIDVSETGHKDRVLQDFDAIRMVQSKNRDIGMIKLVKESDAWNLIQIQILPEFQRNGFATEILSGLITDAEHSSGCVRLSVLKNNPARKLYERLGFNVIGETKHSYEMQNKSEMAR